MRTEGAPSRVAVARAIAFGSMTFASPASANQRSNCATGSALTLASSRRA
jgi:hypothetical protein